MEAGGFKEKTAQAPGCTSGVEVSPKGVAPNMLDKDILGSVQSSMFNPAASLSKKPCIAV